MDQVSALSMMLRQDLVLLREQAKQASDGSSFYLRSASFGEVLLQALDAAGTIAGTFSVDDVRDLHRLERLFIVCKACSPDGTVGLFKYLEMLPGYSFRRMGKQLGSTQEQHGWVIVQFPSLRTVQKVQASTC